MMLDEWERGERVPCLVFGVAGKHIANILAPYQSGQCPQSRVDET